jgi:hypothetical protein
MDYVGNIKEPLVNFKMSKLNSRAEYIKKIKQLERLLEQTNIYLQKVIALNFELRSELEQVKELNSKLQSVGLEKP